MKKIIFIYPYSFMNRDYHRFGLEYLENNGYSVEIWIVANGISYKSKLKMSAGMYSSDNMYDIPLLLFDRKVKENRNSIYFFSSYQSEVYMRTMSKYDCRYIIVEGVGKVLIDNTRYRICHKKGSKTVINMARNLIEHYNSRLRNRKLDKAFEIFTRNLPQYVFLGTDVRNKWIECVPDDRKIYIHSFDYDRYIETNRKTKVNEKFILYIDGGWGSLHQDLFICPYYDPWRESDDIWEKLENTFDLLEKYYHMPVVIAGHPHVKYNSSTLCNRKIILNRTPELVAKAKFAIMQWSTAISFLLLYKKDILVLIDNDFKKNDFWNTMCTPNYKYFGITPCNMDIPKMANAPWEYVHKIDEQIAQKYINEYIKKPETPKKLFAEVVEEKIREMG